MFAGPTQLHAVAPCAAGILIAGAPAAAAGGHDLVFRARVKHRGGRQAPRHARLHARLQVGAKRRRQAEIQAGLATGAVRDFVQRGRFKSAPVRRVQADIVTGCVTHRRHGQGLAIACVAAVVAIAGGKVVVVGVEADRAVAQARVQGPARRHLPRRLHIGVGVVHGVGFVAPQRALHAQGRVGHRAGEVLIALAVFLHGIVGKAANQGQRPAADIKLGRPAHIRAAVFASQVDDAARLRGRQLYGGGN